ncbi:helix-turn-helix transcriptional regulator [Pseudomonas fluorescens]|uniref:Helix-turn-helix transcriptional regulator n=1 Tax=Pseudomonas fluorescens TaxID=294 RepID=A0A944DJ56_PSEFL|nr:LuxR C-terminal-related transcriptional regulator [Pseudomonas fluorescens]MBT2298046.1 helix-turn-helix transcriptional regulator [Pseudomonas fluorescens]MBT2309831.1 helix-turn-helix transcriptional regulator [Pseudomonas fluorescens]MBT2314994.1 helix-turn-helix transcriptional regulator [Pseudomonas fluorescens]MBT2327900.1 helix-turn-helix transcriptional regulator [Pseudomonas fluorescens]MBT2345647.1 helix-turn-helix transcriptional regulator [Pseudomonas fluorescens]
MSRSDPRVLLQAFSTLTLDLHRLAQDQDIDHFHRHALERISQLLPFDSAWWGRAAVIDGLPEEHSTYLYNLPPTYLADWQSMRHVDVAVALTQKRPDQAVIFDMRDPANGAALNWLGERHDIGELLCIVHVDPQTCLSDHLSLYRKPGAPRFNQQDCHLLSNLMLHLVASVSANLIRTLVAMRETLTSPRNLALAVCDRRGVLQSSERGFVDLLLSEWPQWTGPCLPVKLGDRGYEGRLVHIEASAVGDQTLLAARINRALPQLSPRENDVAQGFGEGKTYKEVARDLGLSPNTVRHHIRAIYSKLGVKDKVRIAHLLNTPPD